MIYSNMGYVYAIGDVRLYMDTWLAYDCILFLGRSFWLLADD